MIILVVAGMAWYGMYIAGHNKTATAYTETYTHTSTAITTETEIDTLPQTRNSIQKQQRPLKKWDSNIPLRNIVQFAQTLKGTPYLYASSDPTKGFDCSGFITYVFNHFGVNVPRSSVDFTDKGVEVPVNKAKPGDLILFTGTDSTIRIVGHMGIVVDNSDSLRFIHSSSGKANGVTITPLNSYYLGRFMKVIAIEKGL